MKTKKFLPLFMAAITLALLFSGCKGNNGGTDVPSDISYEEGVSDTDDIVKTSPAEKVILAVSFGTSFNQSRSLDIGGIEAALKEAYPDYQIRRAFTAQIIIDKLAERDNLIIDNIEQAMDRLVLDKVKEVIVQPTTVMNGYEYDDVIAAVTPYAGKFESLKIGRQLLDSDADYDAVAEILTSELAKFEAADTTVLLMGHGTHHAANATYPKFEETLKNKGHDDIFVGTVEGGVLIEDLQALLKEKGVRKVVLRPLMIVAGDHANNDMAGGEEDSWKTILLNDGYEVETVIEGLGQVKGIQEIFIRHVQDAINSDNLSGAEPAAETAGLAAAGIKDGEYSIDVSSSTSMFKITDCRLIVDGGSMTAVMTLSGQGFSKVYMGTGEQALSDSEDNFINYADNGDKHAFTVPVEALDKDLDCAGLSARKEQWYDHIVVFKSDKIPDDAFLPCQTDVLLTGGSGKSSVQSPAKLIRKDGAYYAEIIWSSPNYTYMIADGIEYLPVNADGNSTFEIPVVMDADMDVTACTVAMSSPKEIEYTLNFDSSSIKYD